MIEIGAQKSQSGPIAWPIIDGFVDKYLLTYFFFQRMTKAAFSHSAEDEAWRLINIWPKTEYPSQILKFLKLLSICFICSFNLNFANPFLMIAFFNPQGPRSFKKFNLSSDTIKIFIWFYQKWNSIPWIISGKKRYNLSLYSFKLKIKTFLSQKRRPSILNKTLVAEAKGWIVKIFCFGWILWPSVDHWRLKFGHSEKVTQIGNNLAFSLRLLFRIKSKYKKMVKKSKHKLLY